MKARVHPTTRATASNHLHQHIGGSYRILIFLLRICSIWNKLQTKKQANEPGKVAIFVIINV